MLRVLLLPAIVWFCLAPLDLHGANRLSWTEQIPVATYQQMREVERYQLQIAEKHYLQGEYRIALAEYEKFLGLYERSSGAPYAQLMWSHCQVRLRQVNTAIREGFQSVIDYWPDSQEAVLAGYLIAKSHQDIGETGKAKVAYRTLLEVHEDGPISVSAKRSLLEIARTEKKEEEVLSLLENLAFETKRTDATKRTCQEAASELASWHLNRGNWEEGQRALATTYKEGSLRHHLFEKGTHALRGLLKEQETRPRGEELAGHLLSMAETAIPTDLGTDEAKAQTRTSLYRIASIQGQLGKPDLVLKTFDRVGRMTGVDDDLRGRIANHHRHANDREKARQIYRQYDNQVAGLSALAQMLREDGKRDEAIAQYRELIQLHADGTNTYLHRIAELYEEKHDWRTAIQTWRQVDNFPENYFRMGHCHRRIKEWKEALSMYAQAKSSEPHAARALLSIAHTYEDAGEREKAIKSFQLTCRSFPKSGEASRAHAHLQTKYNINVTLGGAKDE